MSSYLSINQAGRRRETEAGITRRDVLRTMGTGFGMAGLASTLGAATTGNLNPLAPKAPHFPAKAKHVIFLFLNGGPSQVDTFDPKPMLDKYHGQPAPPGNLKTERKTGTLLKSPFAFKPYGQSGIEISELFPRLGGHADDLCVISSDLKSEDRAEARHAAEVAIRVQTIRAKRHRDQRALSATRWSRRRSLRHSF